MQYTGHDTVLRDSSSVTSNKYLEEIEVWKETDLPYYKSKVRGKIFSGYTSIIAGVFIVYAFYILFTAIVFSAFPSFVDLLEESATVGLILTAITYLPVFLGVFFFSKKSMVEFVDSCHGEINAKKSPLMRKVTVNLIFSIILCVAVSGAVILFAMNKLSSGFAIYELTRNCACIIAPVAYFAGMIATKNQLEICPVCGRLNTVYKVKSSNDFGEKKDGSHNEYDYKSERVGTLKTTTKWSDGSTSVDYSPIYERIRYTEEYDDYSNLAKYTYYCHECSYVETTVEKTSWKILKSKYRG